VDPTVQVAFIGIVTTFLTTAGVVVVAMMNNKKERSGSAEAGIVITLRERILLRDEQIADLRADVAERDLIISQQLEAMRLLEGEHSHE
jgi:hypothetical protein